MSAIRPQFAAVEPELDGFFVKKFKNGVFSARLVIAIVKTPHNTFSGSSDSRGLQIVHELAVFRPRSIRRSIALPI